MAEVPQDKTVTLEEAMARYPEAETFSFGDEPALSADILRLVRAGKKTVTCDALDAFAARGEALPVVGRIDIALDTGGHPACAIRTVEVLHVPFADMTDDLVTAHGEFRNVPEWKAGYEVELTRSGHFHPDVIMLVERFELVEDFGGQSDA